VKDMYSDILGSKQVQNILNKPVFGAQRVKQAVRSGEESTIMGETIADALDDVNAGVAKQSDNIKILEESLGAEKRRAIDPDAKGATELFEDKISESVKIVDKKIKEAGKQKGAVIKKIEKKKVVTSDVTDEFIQKAEDQFNLKMVDGKLEKFGVSSLSQSDINHLNDTIGDMRTIKNVKDLDQQSMRMADLANPKSDANVLLKNDKLSSFIMSGREQLRTKIDEALPADEREVYSELRDLFVAREEMKDALGVKANRGVTLMNRLFSYRDSEAKRIFNKIFDVTGIDLKTQGRYSYLAKELYGAQEIKPSVGQAIEKGARGLIQAKFGNIVLAGKEVVSGISEAIKKGNTKEDIAEEMIRVAKLTPEQVTKFDKAIGAVAGKLKEVGTVDDLQTLRSLIFKESSRLGTELFGEETDNPEE